MEKTLKLIQEPFESSSVKTPQYLNFHRTFKREFTKEMNPICKNILIHKPNHFDVSGFFELINGKIYYFSIGDLRWDKNSILIRTAKDFKDYSGGVNEHYQISVLNNLPELMKQKEGI